jgi:hypothetical protein
MFDKKKTNKTFNFNTKMLNKQKHAIVEDFFKSNAEIFIVFFRRKSVFFRFLLHLRTNVI